jgi:hypothetical protein
MSEAETDNYWIEFVLAKVPNESRRSFLRTHFTEDVDKFYRLMREQKKSSLLEFRTGVLLQLPKLTDHYKQSLVRNCIGCKTFAVLPRFTPWGEHIPEIPLCSTCNGRLNENSMTTDKDNPIERIQSLQKDITKEIDILKNQLAEKLVSATTYFEALTSEDIGLTKEELLADSRIKNLVELFIPSTSTRKGPRNVKEPIKRKRRKMSAAGRAAIAAAQKKRWAAKKK